MAESTRTRKINTDNFKKSLESQAFRWKQVQSHMTPDDFMFATDFVQHLEPVLNGNELELISDMRKTLEESTNYFKERAWAWRKGVVDAIRKIHEEGEWDDFINLDIIEEPKTIAVSRSQEAIAREATVKAWSHAFRGENHRLLWTHISYYYRNRETRELYGNLCSVVQSSGTGKSRTVDELGKHHFVIPMNLSRVESGYPPPDKRVEKYLMTNQGSSDIMRGRCFLFLNGLFKHTQVILKSAKEKGIKDKQTMITWFHDKMAPLTKNDFRDKFYEDVLNVAKERRIEVSKVVAQHPTPNQASIDPPSESDLLVIELNTSANKLVETLRELSPSSSSEAADLQVVIAFDEAHVLCKNSCFDPKSKRPSSMFVMFREAFHTLRSVAVWALVLSTTGKLSQFNPHHGVDPSLRVRTEEYSTVPPFTDLTYDLFAPCLKYVESNGTIQVDTAPDRSEPRAKKQRDDGMPEYVNLTLERATQMDFIVGFGRPLFALRYKYGNKSMRDGIIRFAVVKLICHDPWPHGKYDHRWANDSDALFACLSQRLFLEFNMSNYNVAEEEQIASHMRLCLKIQSDNQFVSSWTPSEPLLAEAAAMLMLMEEFKPAESLKKIVSRYSIDIGDRGELVAALAVTVARDSAVRKQLARSAHEETLADLPIAELETKPFVRAVTIVEFLEQMFDLNRAMSEREKQVLSEDFLDAYIYFNHFIKPLDQSTCTLESLLKCFTRGIALRCATNMPGIDSIFGILFSSPEGIVLRLDRTTVWILQIKNDASITISHWEELLKRMNPFLIDLFMDVDEPLPVVRTACSLAAKTEELSYSKSVVDLGNGKSVVCHDFWCGGMGDFFLPCRTDDLESWKALLNTTMNKDEIFNERITTLRPAATNRKRMATGASCQSEFWPWVPNSK